MKRKPRIDNDLEELISDETYEILNSHGLLDKKAIRDYKIRKMFKKMRKEGASAGEAIEKIGDIHKYLQFDTIRKIVYQISAKEENKTKRKTHIDNPLKELISDEIYELLRNHELLDDKSIRDYEIRKMFKEMRKQGDSAGVAIEKIGEIHKYLQFDTIRKIVYQFSSKGLKNEKQTTYQ